MGRPRTGRRLPDDFRDPSVTRSGTGRDPFRDPLGDPLRTDASRDDLRRDDPGVVPEEREPVVMHQSPGGPVVLEGVVVEPQAGGLPRRATTPAPRPPAEERFDEPAADRFDTPTRAAVRPTRRGPRRPSPARSASSSPARSASTRRPRSGPARERPTRWTHSIFRWTIPPRPGPHARR